MRADVTTVQSVTTSCGSSRGPRFLFPMQGVVLGLGTTGMVYGPRAAKLLHNDELTAKEIQHA